MDETLAELAQLRARLGRWPLQDVGALCYLVPGLDLGNDVTLDQVNLEGADLARPFGEVLERIRKEIAMSKEEEGKKEEPPAPPSAAAPVAPAAPAALPPTTAELKKLVEAAAAGSASAQAKLDALVERHGAVEKRVEALEAELRKKEEPAAPAPAPRKGFFDYLGF